MFYRFSKQHRKISLRGFKGILKIEDIFQPTTGNEILYEDSNENVVRIVNLATLKSLLLRTECFTTDTFVKTPVTLLMESLVSIDRLLVYRRWHACMHAHSKHDIPRELTTILFTLAGGCTGQGKPSVNKQAARKINVKRFKRKWLSELKFRKQYRIMISNIQAAEPLVPESTAVQLQMQTENTKRQITRS